MLDHLFGDVDVGDDAITQRSNRLDLIGGLAHHELGIVADRLDSLDAVDGLDRDHGWLVEDHAAAADIDDGVSRAEVDCHVVGRKLQKTQKGHVRRSRFHQVTVPGKGPVPPVSLYRMPPPAASRKQLTIKS
jgi:hypothetical protein